jgi:glutathione S-transferase
MKHILYCADGTWNGPGDPGDQGDIDAPSSPAGEGAARTTNVWKTFLNLAGDVTPQTAGTPREQEKVWPGAAGAPAQVAKYMHGVGDSPNLVIKAIGGALGVGVIARIVRGYTYISRNYVLGDAIHIVGFSRGAYTARALAGMIAAVGLLDSATYDSADRFHAYVLGYGAWLKARGVVFGGGGSIARWFTGIFHSAELLAARLLFSKKDFITPIPIRSVAVWDTVGSMGIPLYVNDQRRDMFSFVDTKLSPLVQRGFHAMALDERRRDFPVTRWVARKDVEEVWFSGCHSDVGGGYPPGETGLSDLALAWMMARLQAQGVTFASNLLVKPDLTHYAQDFHKPSETPPFNIDPQPRSPAATDTFDPTVQRRWVECTPYRACWPADSVVAQVMQRPGATTTMNA